MVKRIFYLMLVLVLLINMIGCSSKVELPEGFENREFYEDMIKCLDLTKKTLETKNTKYMKEAQEILDSHRFKEDRTEDTYTNKEESVMGLMSIVININLKIYMERYFDDIDGDVQIILDDSSVEGRMLIKSIQEVVSEMELEYELDFE